MAVIARDAVASDHLVYAWPFPIGVECEVSCSEDESVIMCPAWVVADRLGPGRHLWRTPDPTRPVAAYFVLTAPVEVQFDLITSFIIPSMGIPVRLRAIGSLQIACADPALLVAQFVGLPFDNINEGVMRSVSRSVERMLARLLTRRVVMAGTPIVVTDPSMLMNIMEELIAYNPTAGSVFGIELMRMGHLNIIADDGSAPYLVPAPQWVAPVERPIERSGRISNGDGYRTPMPPAIDGYQTPLPPAAPIESVTPRMARAGSSSDGAEPPPMMRAPTPVMPQPAVAPPVVPSPIVPSPSTIPPPIRERPSAEQQRAMRSTQQGLPPIPPPRATSPAPMSGPPPTASGEIFIRAKVPEDVPAPRNAAPVEVQSGEDITQPGLSLLRTPVPGSLRASTAPPVDVDPPAPPPVRDESPRGSILGVGMTSIGTGTVSGEITKKVPPGGRVLVPGPNGLMQSATVRQLLQGYYELEVGSSGETIWVPINGVVPD